MSIKSEIADWIAANPGKWAGDVLGAVSDTGSAMTIDLRFKRLHPEAVLPVRKTDGSAGYDVVALGRVHDTAGGRQLFPVILHPGRVERLRTGWAVEIPIWTSTAPSTATTAARC